MSFQIFEDSRTLGGPVDLYFFKYGSGLNDFYAYTDGDEVHIFGGISYLPRPISRSSIASSGTLDKAELKVNTTQDSEVSELFRVYPPSQVVTLVIRQGHPEDADSDYPVVWTGRVLSCMRVRNEAVFSCEPISTSMQRSGLRRHYQLSCPHALYGKQCRASMAAATLTFQPTAINGSKVTLPVGWQPTARISKYVGGIARWAVKGRQELRTILRIENERTLLLTGIARGLTTATAIEVILGCNHTMADCADLHDNILNFGGQPWIPLKSPLGNSNNFY